MRKLEEVYQSNSQARKATLLKQLLFTKISDIYSMVDHLNNFFNTVDKLNEMNIVVPDDLLSILLLYSIPSNFENFLCAIEARDKLPVPELLKIKQLEKADTRKGRITGNSQGAFYVEPEYRGNQPWFIYSPATELVQKISTEFSDEKLQMQ